jgi:hypothetical protein
VEESLPQILASAGQAPRGVLRLMLAYAGRQWKAEDKTFTSLEFSKYSMEQFAKLFAK